jgi:hypothetical protein
MGLVEQLRIVTQSVNGAVRLLRWGEVDFLMILGPMAHAVDSYLPVITATKSSIAGSSSCDWPLQHQPCDAARTAYIVNSNATPSIGYVDLAYFGCLLSHHILLVRSGVLYVKC